MHWPYKCYTIKDQNTILERALPAWVTACTIVQDQGAHCSDSEWKIFKYGKTCAPYWTKIILIYSYHAYDICCINTQVANVVLLHKNAAAPPRREAPANAACMRGYIKICPPTSVYTHGLHPYSDYQPSWLPGGLPPSTEPQKERRMPRKTTQNTTRRQSQCPNSKRPCRASSCRRGVS